MYKFMNLLSSGNANVLFRLSLFIKNALKIRNTTNKMEFLYTLVADSESNIKSGKLSVNSPIGKGLLGKSVGDVAEIQVPNGIMTFEIIEISR